MINTLASKYFFVLNRQCANYFREIVKNRNANKTDIMRVLINLIKDCNNVSSRKTHDSLEKTYRCRVKSGPILYITVNYTEELAPDGNKRMAFIKGVYEKQNYRLAEGGAE